MISLTTQLYSELASRLLGELGESEELFNGKVEYDDDQFYSTLTCTLIIYRKKSQGRECYSEIENIVPVWWDYSVWADGLEEDNDFSWAEFKEYLF